VCSSDLNATLPALFYLVGISSWAAHEGGDENIWYWALLAAAIPHLYKNIKKDNPTIRGNLLGWALMATLGVAWFSVIEVRVPENILLGTSVMLSLIYFLGMHIYPSSEQGILRPFRTFAIGGIFIMTMILGYEWGGFTDNDPFSNFIYGQRYDRTPALINFGIIVMAFLCLVYFAFSAFRQMKRMNYWVASFPIMILVGLLLTRADKEIISIILANFFLLGFGIYYIQEGIRIRKLSLINVGMLFLTAMIVARFFDADLSLVWKGIVFILLGIGFVSVNIIMSRRLKES